MTDIQATVRAAVEKEREEICAMLASAEPSTRAAKAIERISARLDDVPGWLAGDIAEWLEATADELAEIQEAIRARGHAEDIAEHSVCPGCHSVDEPCLPGCIDDEMERDREERGLYGEPSERFDGGDDEP